MRYRKPDWPDRTGWPYRPDWLIRLIKLTRLTRLIRKMFSLARMREGWCENCQNMQNCQSSVSISEWVSDDNQCKRCWRIWKYLPFCRGEKRHCSLHIKFSQYLWTRGGPLCSQQISSRKMNMSIFLNYPDNLTNNTTDKKTCLELEKK